MLMGQLWLSSHVNTTSYLLFGIPHVFNSMLTSRTFEPDHGCEQGRSRRSATIPHESVKSLDSLDLF